MWWLHYKHPQVYFSTSTDQAVQQNWQFDWFVPILWEGRLQWSAFINLKPFTSPFMNSTKTILEEAKISFSWKSGQLLRNIPRAFKIQHHPANKTTIFRSCFWYSTCPIPYELRLVSFNWRTSVGVHKTRASFRKPQPSTQSGDQLFMDPGKTPRGSFHKLPKQTLEWVNTQVCPSIKCL